MALGRCVGQAGRVADDVFPDRWMDHRDKLAWMIESTGWALEVVDAEPEATPPKGPYAYTVGLETALGFPEVAVFGLTPVAARGLIGLVVELVAGGTEVPIGPLFTGLLDNDLRAGLLPVDLTVHGERFTAAAAWYGDGQGYRMVQLAWPDRNGWLPWEPGFERRLTLAQPVVGSLDEL